MYIDYIKNNYSDKTEQEKQEYIARDKKCLAGLIQERITNDIEGIVDRWYELDDVGYIPENEKFLYLLKEAEQLYSFSYYTGTISIIGIAAEEYCRYLIRKNNITDVDTQFLRINKLAAKGVLTAQMKTTFHRIRDIRNDCMHYKDNFKILDNAQLKAYALEMIQLYKSGLSISTVSLAENYNKVSEDMLNSKEMTFREFLYRNRNIEREIRGLDLQIDPKIQNLIYTSQYYVAEIDIATDVFKEMTLLDMDRGLMPAIVDLTLPQAEMIKKLKLEEGHIIIATIMSNVTTLGQTEEWLLLDIKDIYREITGLSELSNLMQRK
jgi:hypothetical protein